jgi:hypothetical protein
MNSLQNRSKASGIFRIALFQQFYSYKDMGAFPARSAGNRAFRGSAPLHSLRERSAPLQSLAHSVHGGFFGNYGRVNVKPLTLFVEALRISYPVEYTEPVSENGWFEIGSAISNFLPPGFKEGEFPRFG